MFELLIIIFCACAFACCIGALSFVLSENTTILVIRWFEWLGRRGTDKTLTFEEYISWFKVEE